MNFNSDKCKLVTRHNSGVIYHGDSDNPIYSLCFLDGLPSKSVGVEKDLGIDITLKLNWKHQIDRAKWKNSARQCLRSHHAQITLALRSRRAQTPRKFVSAF